MSQVEKHAEDYVWQSIASIASIEELGKTRMKAMEIFLDDYELGKKSGRYINASLPCLPFSDSEFGLALCSHYLFLYSDHVDENQHILAMTELCRVSKEVRVYPVLSLDGNASKHLQPVILVLSKKGIDVSLQSVKYQFQKGATQMLVAKSA